MKFDFNVFCQLLISVLQSKIVMKFMISNFQLHNNNLSYEGVIPYKNIK